MKKVIGITQTNHYLIHVFYKDLTGEDIHAYTYKQLNEKITKIANDPKVHDYYIYMGIDFEVVDEKEDY